MMSKPRALFLVATLVFCFMAGRTAQAEGIFLNGSLWRTEGDSRVFVIANDQKRHIPSEAILRSYGWNFTDVQLASAEILATVPDVRVVKSAASATVYKLVDSIATPFASETEFLAAGFLWEDVVLINEIELAVYYSLSPVAEVAPKAVTSVTPTILEKIKEAREILHKAAPLYAQQKSVALTQTLAPGAQGSDVERVQKILQTTGYFPKSVGVNGLFGPTTTAAVKAFQKAEGIEQTGQVGPKTLTALEKNGLVSAGTVVRQWRDTVPKERQVLLSAWNSATDDFKTIHVSLAGTTVVTRTPGFSVRYVSGNGVNVHYDITAPAGYQVLANRFPIFDEAGGKVGTFPPREEVYVPFSSAFLAADVVAAGRAYMDEIVSLALTDLTKRGVQSVSGKGLVGELTDADELKNIAIIEHMDYNEFRRATDKNTVVNKVFAILATNREDAYRFSGSSAGALGLAQFIPSSYEGMRKRYPAANLKASFKEGMADHVNAFKAMALHHDSTGATLESAVLAHVSDDPAELSLAMAEVRAAAYNGGAARVKSALTKYQEQWKVTVNSRYGLRSETRSYLEKFDAVKKLLSILPA